MWNSGLKKGKQNPLPYTLSPSPISPVATWRGTRVLSGRKCPPCTIRTVDRAFSLRQDGGGASTKYLLYTENRERIVDGQVANSVSSFYTPIEFYDGSLNPHFRHPGGSNGWRHVLTVGARRVRDSRALRVIPPNLPRRRGPRRSSPLRGPLVRRRREPGAILTNTWHDPRERDALCTGAILTNTWHDPRREGRPLHATDFAAAASSVSRRPPCRRNRPTPRPPACVRLKRDQPPV
ncbi:hypothetical protein SKAU_G00242030 [Synaphobranchus kaupii]|uniref:Uncharacterized protein n=1 Tax=Synaphobranchus kaupii TaxID=118154 RepID=A0A9Q1F7M9_SYNKA|nr:hypothetical protein SKAU_G00242030 [Synaphobranchus kaupii]